MEGSARGNYGITDLIAALHWIQENIAQFGGDSKNVTLLGQGHGAALVHFLVLSPMTKGSSLFPLGLFHRAIMLSGSALSPWAIAREANQYAQKLSSTLECPINDPAITLECLRQRSVSDILGVDIKVPTFLSGFGPTIDGIVIQGEPETLLEVQSEEYPIDSIEVMFGISKSTSYFQVTQQEESEGFGIGRRDKLLRTLVRNIFSYHLQEIFLTIINEYTDWSKTPQHNVNVLESTLDALGDALFVAPVIRAANYHSEGQSVVYFYVFNYQTEGDKYLEKQRCFCEALEYIFGTPVLGYPGYLPKNFSDNERIFSEAVMTYLINFVKSGNPNSFKVEKTKEKHRSKIDKSWPIYDNVHQKYMMLGVKQKVRDHYHAHRLSYWLNLFPKLHRTRSENINLEHSFLIDHDNPLSYEGPVREVPVILPRIVTNATASPKIVTSKNDTSKDTAKTKTVTTVQVNYQLPTKDLNVTESSGSSILSERYSLVLHATVGAGIILLLLNILIFAGIYYQRIERKANAALRKRNSMQTSFQELQVHQSVITHKKAVTFRDPPSSLMYQTGDLALQPPSHYKHPHKVHLKPCTIPTPPELSQK
ncbi:neuroligin-1 [Parasteatoda tepidariorum]|uniref:neuroligin-1 n=1 Tax=Parasteatoda tepidariorum TaxID=114398 RepID=UPI0039BD3338